MLITTPSYHGKDLPGQLPPDCVDDGVNLDEVASVILEFVSNPQSEVLSEDVLWRDWMSLTGLPQTLYSRSAVYKTWTKAVLDKKITEVEVTNKIISKPCPGTSWVSVGIEYQTNQKNGLKGHHSGNAFLVPSGRTWKIWCLTTILEYFEGYGHPDQPRLRPDRSISPKGVDYAVVIVGAGQGGLALAGRLKAMNVSCVIVEKRSVVGASWSERYYESVKQHTIREFGNLPFGRTFNEDDPNLLPGKMVAEGYQKYAEKYELDVLLNTEIVSCTRDDGSATWSLKLSSKEIIKSRTLVIATGPLVTVPSMPSFPGSDSFKGKLIHLSEFRNAKPFSGKAVIIGSGTAGHDIAKDCLDGGMEVTMIQRGRTAIYPIEWVVKGQQGLYNNKIPTDVADRIGASPNKVVLEMMNRNTKAIAQQPEWQAFFNDLEKAGFRVDRESAMYDLIYDRGGGYYIDVGASKRIIDGSIKVKAGPIRSICENSVLLESGEDVPADLIVAATGWKHDYREQAADIIGMEMAEQLPEWFGLDENGDVRGLMKESRQGLWLVGGPTSMNRWMSRFTALGILLDLLEIDNLVH